MSSENSPSTSEAIEPPNLPTREEFQAEMEAYIDGLNAKKKEKALLSLDQYKSICYVLQHPSNTSQGTAQFRFWAKKMFTLSPVGGRMVVIHENRPVAVKGQIYEILCFCHQTCAHGGRDKTSATVRCYWSWIPKDLIARFVKVCPQCRARRSNNKPAFGVLTSVPSSSSYTNSASDRRDSTGSSSGYGSAADPSNQSGPNLGGGGVDYGGYYQRAAPFFGQANDPSQLEYISYDHSPFDYGVVGGGGVMEGEDEDVDQLIVPELVSPDMVSNSSRDSLVPSPLDSTFDLPPEDHVDEDAPVRSLRRSHRPPKLDLRRSTIGGPKSPFDTYRLDSDGSFASSSEYNISVSSPFSPPLTFAGKYASSTSCLSAPLNSPGVSSVVAGIGNYHPFGSESSDQLYLGSPLTQTWTTADPNSVHLLGSYPTGSREFLAARCQNILDSVVPNPCQDGDDSYWMGEDGDPGYCGYADSLDVGIDDVLA